MIDDELVHTIKQIATQSGIEHRPFVYGHVSNYDPVTHTVRVIVPSMRDDQTGAPLHSGWLPLGTSQSGNQSGLQIVPLGGATADNPTAGELCLVGLNERGTGVAAVLCLFYTSAQQPPHTALASGHGLQPGEVILRHVSGTLVRLHQNGDAEVTTGGNGAVNVATSGSGGINLTTTGSGPIVLTSGVPVQVHADMHVYGQVIGSFGSNQVGLTTHEHPQGPDSRGDTEENTGPPIPGI